MSFLPRGPLIVDIAGTALTDQERQRLCHPLVGGMILFSRNYESPAQIKALCDEIHGLRDAPLLIAVDHEGGRVQRFRDGFTRLPAMRCLGELWDRDRTAAREAACGVGLVLATELRAWGVDYSFAPVLDLDWGRSGVIGDRSFHRDPVAVIALASSLIDGMRAGGMACCGKHFPGHGWVEADSHVAIPVDERPLDALQADMEPFRRLALDAVMPAHVIYTQVDEQPAGFSPTWLTLLRQDIGFDGVIFSDDLSMEGASIAGDVVARVEAAWNAGCDMLLVCNAPDSVGDVLERWRPTSDPVRAARLARLIPGGAPVSIDAAKKNPAYAAGLASITRLLA
ncbi:MAG: beta-N-acetylhexosaminidase [Rhodocyclaceae bacterium]|nr:beta-N-acetylhexosaminidase [Rhodocyclaceae bacterium]